jgi:repressor LexA
MSDLTPRQQAILDYLREFVEERDYPPTVRDIQDACRISSTSVVDYNLKRLEEKGYIRRAREVSRGIEILDRRRRMMTIDVPVLGQIAAGQPIPVPSSDRWAADVDDSITVTADLVGDRTNVFALRVKGQSMIEDLIDDGDIVILEPIHTANEGDKVAVWLKDREEVTLKRIYHEPDGRIRLQPANRTMAPIYADPLNVEIQGRLVSVIRS